MRVTRVHVALPLAAGSEVVLPENAATHLSRVLRLSVGDACVLFNGDGCDYAARIVATGKRVCASWSKPLPWWIASRRWHWCCCRASRAARRWT